MKVSNCWSSILVSIFDLLQRADDSLEHSVPLQALSSLLSLPVESNLRFTLRLAKEKVKLATGNCLIKRRLGSAPFIYVCVELDYGLVWAQQLPPTPASISWPDKRATCEFCTMNLKFVLKEIS